jgi:glycosyltransferase involved in cell wall biosynthesis
MFPKVSILIPCYNAATYIAETIQSALKQSWPNTEIIIIDDGSSDNSFSVAQDYASGNLKVYRQPNSGACRARNLAFEKSTGDYIQYLDADDLISPNKIEVQMSLFSAFGNDMVASCRWSKFYQHPGEAIFHSLGVYKDYKRPLDILLDMWSGQEMMQTSVWLSPRKIIEAAGPWNEGLAINQDGEFFCRVMMAAAEVRFEPEGKVYYRTGIPNSVSVSKGDRLKAEALLKSFRLYEDHVEAFMAEERVKEAIAMNYYSFIYIYYHLYRDLAALAVSRVRHLNVPPPLGKIGAPRFRKLSPFLGFYTVLRLRRALHSLKN